MSKRIVSLTVAFLLFFCSCIFVGPNSFKVSAAKAAETVYADSQSEEDLPAFSDYSAAIGGEAYSADGIILETPSDYSGEKGEKGVRLTQKGQSVTFNCEIMQSGWYQPNIYYLPVKDQGNSIDIGFMIDGNYPYSELTSVLLARQWNDRTDEIQSDEKGNQFALEQVEVLAWKTAYLSDINGFINTPLTVWLEKGGHSFTVLLNSEKVEIGCITLSAPEKVISDAEWKEIIKTDGYKNYSGNEIVLEGEAAQEKSSRFLSALSNRNNSSVKPSDPYREMINYIGGGNWKDVGDTVTWSFSVPSDGLYKIGFHFHQTYLRGAASFRTLRIDGKIPFKSAESIGFPYKSSWQFMTLGDDDGEIPVYLTAGEHELSLSVTLGRLSEFSEELKTLVAKIGTVYRQIVMITGENPDSERDYDLFGSIPELSNDLEEIYSTLERLADESEEIYGSKGGTNAQIIRKAALTVSQMLAKKFKAQTKLNAYYENYASLSSWLYEMQDMALDLDCIVLASPEREFVRGEEGTLKSAVYTVKRLIATFINDYDTGFKSKQDSITLWSNWGMDQLKVLSSLINSDFTPKHGINVNLRITNANMIQANLSGNGPDVQINLARTEPVNYAMRNAIYDLSRFDDYNTVIKRFSKVATEPYKYNGGCYALPDTEIFSMLFVRTDIFEELNLQIPETWDEFLQTLKVLSLNNMQVAVAAGANFFLAQKGVDMYNEDHTATNLTSAEAIEALTFWTDLYTKYNIPKTVDFFSRFRTGLVPMGIQPISMYSTLQAAAPEISGKWVMSGVPGYKNEDAGISNATVGDGTASVILSGSDNKSGAWEFLKWWTSEDIQYRFSMGVEAVIGVSGRHMTANSNAFFNLGWDGVGLSALKQQREQLFEYPEVPGSYYVARSTQQIYWNVLNNGQNINEMINKWIPEADAEIARKTAEYSN